MNANDRIQKFIELQNKEVPFEDISKELGIKKSTLRGFLNKRGYKCENGKYVLVNKVDQIKFEEFENKTTTKNIKKNTIKKIVKENKIVNTTKVTKKTKNNNVKKDKKINVTQEDMDKLCEVYDWYLQVKDFKSIKSKKISNKKDINIEDTNIEDTKSTTIKIDKKTWEEFERLCSNSQFNKKEILTQALKNFMKEYKHLL